MSKYLENYELFDITKEFYEKQFYTPGVNLKYQISSFISDIEFIFIEEFGVKLTSNEFLTDRQAVIDKYSRNYKKEENYKNALEKIVDFYEDIIEDLWKHYRKLEKEAFACDEFINNKYIDFGEYTLEIFKYISENYDSLNKDIYKNYYKNDKNGFLQIEKIYTLLNYICEKNIEYKYTPYEYYDYSRELEFWKDFCLNRNDYICELLIRNNMNVAGKYEYIKYMKNYYNTEI